MTLTTVAIIIITGITGLITLTFAAYQEWRIKIFEKEILRCLKIIRYEMYQYKKEKELDTDWRIKKCK